MRSWVRPRSPSDAGGGSAARGVVPAQGLDAFLRMVDDGFGVAVGVAVGDTPWLVDPAPGHVRELRHPSADVVAVRIELLALGDRVEDAEVRRSIGAGAGNPLPVL